MADPICRWRNATPKTICEIVESLPKEEMNAKEFRKIMLESKWGVSFSKTIYQFACQTGLYYVDEKDIYHPRFRSDISEFEAESYLTNWFKKYYVPNPYTRGFDDIDKPLLVVKTLEESLIKNPNENNFSKLCSKLFKSEVGELDIFRNVINRYSGTLKIVNDVIEFIPTEQKKMEIDIDRNDKRSFFESFTTPSTQPPKQTIYYGVPGSGKSYRIDEITKNLSEEQKIRVVFHPEYTNADFVGQILPCLTSDGIEYRFKAGPFSRILKKAYQNPDKPHYLIIEEINRGNAAAIFGDLFQLLDRDSEGWSSYKIENLDINSFIRSKDSTYSDAKIESSVNIGGYTWTENTGIRLPPNLSLLATMNTSDQNVFTLDNAFQRRWDMELVPNSCDDLTQMQAKISVKEKTITWESFQSKINEVIAEKGNESGFSSMEDKRLGCWFIKNNEGKIDSKKFANKVLKYLWDDAFKFNRSEIFIDEVKNFEELKNLFIGDKGFEIFKDINFDFEPQNLEENQES